MNELSNHKSKEKPKRMLPSFAAWGMDGWHALRHECAELEETLQDLSELGTDDVRRKVHAMQAELAALSPAITFIGQIKSGKTTLVNALAGRPGLLPADVNPWTSVVTSLHFNHPLDEDSPRARFRFFDEQEWNMLVQSGGRIGELSDRTGADREKERLQQQVMAMFEKTRRRLGRKFEMLMGQEHCYSGFNKELIQRYVCLGDDFDEEANGKGQGQFADITKSADLFLNAPNIPMGCIFRDTPGTNDTFLMREQITIRAVRDARISVLVLSAHQALNSMDMALIRMIANLKRRQVVIFVNRVDELANPVEQIPEIHESLLKTLAAHLGKDAPQVIFGSGLWATAALNRDLDSLPEDSARALAQMVDRNPGVTDPFAQAWQASGVPALHAAMGERVLESAQSQILPAFRRRAGNIVMSMRAAFGIVGKSNHAVGQQVTLNESHLAILEKIEDYSLMKMEEALKSVLGQFSVRAEQAHNTFLTRSVTALQEHLNSNKGGDQTWTYSPDGLRMLIRTAHQVMRRNLKKETAQVMDSTAKALAAQYSKIFGIPAENFVISPPEIEEIPPPVALAQTIVLDVKTTWWKSWWGNLRGSSGQAAKYRELIESETTPLLESLRDELVHSVQTSVIETLETFLSDQRAMLDDLRAKSNVSVDELHELFGVSSQKERDEMFDILCEELGISDQIVQAAQ